MRGCKYSDFLEKRLISNPLYNFHFHLLLLTLQLESIEALKDGILHVAHPPISLLHSNCPAATLVHSAFLGATAVYPGWQTRLHMVSLHSIPSAPATCPSTVSMAGHFSTAAAWTPARTKNVRYQRQILSKYSLYLRRSDWDNFILLNFHDWSRWWRKIFLFLSSLRHLCLIFIIWLLKMKSDSWFQMKNV